MATFAAQARIQAPLEAVWDVLADTGVIHTWDPGVLDSRLASQAGEGVGASRHCDLGGRSYVDEDVVEWSPNEVVTFRTVRSNMPFARADIAFRLQPDGDGARVTVSPDYKMKFGPLGWMMDASWFAGCIARAWSRCSQA